ncbi:hypothetical protein ACLOJK_028037 [Asimina triloba]
MTTSYRTPACRRNLPHAITYPARRSTIGSVLRPNNPVQLQQPLKPRQSMAAASSSFSAISAFPGLSPKTSSSSAFFVPASVLRLHASKSSASALFLKGQIEAARSISKSGRHPLRLAANSAQVMDQEKPIPRVSTIVDVDLGNRSYPIYIGSGLLNQPDLLQRHLHGKKVLVVTNTTVAPLYLDKVIAALTHENPSISVETVVLPDGEKYKNMDTLMKVFDKAIESRLDRRCTFIALGGGVIGDMCGFAAASFLRGVNFIQIPTTLMAQVDSSVGGKTGINHPLGKNMIGAFYQPQSVLIDTDTLSTLPEKELASGIAEVIKYGLIRDAEFFEWQEKNMDALLAREPSALAYAIKRSCENKAEVVSLDEKEGGLRATLNLGHTFGHASFGHAGRLSFGWWGKLMLPLLLRHFNVLEFVQKHYCIQIAAKEHFPLLMRGQKKPKPISIYCFVLAYGQAIETGFGYGEWLHGEAVAAGMVMAVDMSYRLGWIDVSIVERALSILQHAKLPTAPPGVMTVEKFKKIMAVDKKVADGLLRLILLKGPLGNCVFTGDYDRKALDETLHAFCKS